MITVIGQFFRLLTVLAILSPVLSLSTGLLKNLRHRMSSEKRMLPDLTKERLEFYDDTLPQDTIVSVGEDVVLHCEVGGKPSPTIHWLKDGERIIQGLSHDVRDDEARYEEKISRNGIPHTGLATVRSSLYLDCVGGRDAGVYTCVADTPFERITKSSTVAIEGSIGDASKKCLVKKAFPGEPARIYMWTGTRVENQGGDVQLFCRSEGYPLPAVTWKDARGNIINNSQNYKILKNGDLLIMGISWQNFGYHICEVENESGEDNKRVLVYPLRPSKK